MKHLKILALLSTLAPLLSFATASRQDIYFARGDFASERSVPIAVLATVKFGGTPCSVQIDTGMNDAFAWHIDQAVTQDETLEIELGTLRRSVPVNANLRERIGRCSIGSPVASLGNAFFEAGTLEIDFAGSKLTYTSGSKLKPNSASGHFRYAQWGPEGGHVLVHVTAPGPLPAQALLDTGSLRIDLAVHDRHVWRALTQRAKTSPERFPIWAWGRQLQCLKQAATRPISFQEDQKTFPVVTYCPTLGFRPMEPVLGTVGMRRYLRGSIAIDYPARLWRGTASASE